MPSSTDAVVLTEAQAFHEARLLVERAQAETWARFSSDMAAHDGYRLGKLQEALDAASDALFNVINVAASHLRCVESAAAIDMWSGRNETPTIEEVTA